MTREIGRRSHCCTSTYRGVTMSEVLISMLIMSVGIVSLAAIFPASVLRAIQASQLTNSAILAKNVKARLAFDSTILNSGPLTAGSANPANLPDRFVIDPFGCRSLGIPPYFVPSTIANLSNISGSPPTLQAVKRYAGNGLGSVTITQSVAEKLGVLPDSWSFVREDRIVGGYTAGSHQVVLAAPQAELVSITPRTSSSPSLPLYRIVLIDAFGRQAACRTLRAPVVGSLISWRDPADTAGNFAEADLAFTPVRARIEVRESRYTWMLTVRKRAISPDASAWTAAADVVVFFNRSLAAADESSFQVSVYGAPGFDGRLGASGVDDDFNGYVDDSNSPNLEANRPGTDDARTLKFTGPAPANLKKGGYIFEPTQALWYRVVNISIDSNQLESLILVDRDLMRVPAGVFNVVIMRGVVNVVDLGNYVGTP